MRRSALLALSVLILVAPSSPSGGAPEASAESADEGFREHYRSGRQAFGEERWEAVVEHMREAISLRPRERLRLLVLRFGHYLPRYYLGSALAELGRCPEALEVWAEEESQGAVVRVDELWQDLLLRREKCERYVARVAETVRAGRALLAEAREVEESAARKLSSPLLAAEDVLEQLSAAREQLRIAGSGLATAARRHDLTAARRGLDQARRARTSLDALVEVLEVMELEAAEHAEARHREVARLVSQARRVLAASTDLAPLPPIMASHVRSLEATVVRFETEREHPLSSLAELEQTLRRQIAALMAAIQKPPDLMHEAVGAFLSGRFDDVLAYLDGARFEDERVEAHACLLRIAALLGLFRQSGGAEEELRDRAAVEIDGCPGLGEHVLLSPRVIPPEVRAFVAAGIASRNGPPRPAAWGEAEAGEATASSVAAGSADG